MNQPKGGATAEGWHELQALFRCEWEYVAGKIRKIVPAGVTETPEPLARGLVFHAMRAKWFELDFKWRPEEEAKVLEAARLEGQNQRLPISARDEQIAIALFRDYAAHYQYMPLPKPVGVEYTIEPTEVVPGFTRTARLDDVSFYQEGGGSLWIGEAKTTSASMAQTINYYEMSGQLMLQWLLWKHAENGEKKFGPVSGIMLDIAKYADGKGPAEFQRVAVPITENMTNWFKESLRTTLSWRKQIQADGWDAPVVRNPTACQRISAAGRVGWCEFRDLCKHGRAASGNYQFEDGRSLLDHVPSEGKEKLPWE